MTGTDRSGVQRPRLLAPANDLCRPWASRWSVADDVGWGCCSSGGVENGVAGVVAGDEGDAGSAVAAGAAEVEAVDRDGRVEPAAGAGPEGSHELRVEESVAEVATGATKHHVEGV